jgi:hypothetical protein
MILFTPQRREPTVDASLPTHIRTPEGEELAVFSQELATEVESSPWFAGRNDAPRSWHLRRSEHLRDYFDDGRRDREALVAASGRPKIPTEHPDRIVAIRPLRGRRMGRGLLSFGEASDTAAIGITNRDERCSMVNFDP